MNFVACSRSMLATPVIASCLCSQPCARFAGETTLRPPTLEVLVERLHAELRTGLDRGVHLRDLVLADQVPDRGRADHDLVRRDAACAVLGFQ
jgi:hypothetical protein